MPESLRIAVTLVAVLLLASVFGLYVHRRASFAFALDRRGRWVLGTLLLLGILASTLARTLGAGQLSLARPLGALGGAITLGILLSSAFLMPVDLARTLTHWASRLRRKQPPLEVAAALAAPEQPGRRSFVARAAVGSAITLGMGAASYGVLFGRRDYTVETVPIRLAKLPKALDGLTVVQLSDLHVGTFIGERELGAALALVKSARADLVVLTGDLLDHDPFYTATLARFARALAGASRFGVFAIPGNHDHYAGAARVMRSLREAGTEVLLNRHVRVGDAGGSIVVAGVDDIAGPRFGAPGPRLAEALAGAPEELPRILLSHNPAFYARAHPEADLTLSGHTHGGQISLFINPAQLVLGHGLVRGHYRVGESQLYVNRGFGTAGPPVRVGSPPEITRLVLTT